MSVGMLMNSSSSNESNSDDEKCHLPAVDLILTDNEKQNEEQTVVIRHTLRRQQATISLPSSLSIRNTSSLESIDNDDDDDNDVIVCSHMAVKKKHQTVDNNDHDINRISFNESERTDSGIGRNSGSSWKLSSYSDSLHDFQQQERIDKQQGMDLLLNEMHVFMFEYEIF